MENEKASTGPGIAKEDSEQRDIQQQQSHPQQDNVEPENTGPMREQPARKAETSSQPEWVEEAIRMFGEDMVEIKDTNQSED